MVKKIKCPKCGKWLCSVRVGAKGVVYIWCKQCKKEIELEIE